MSYKPNFKIKHDRIESNKDAYDHMSKAKRNLRKDEPFVLMFRNFIFFDVKSYECRNGDLYIRNVVDGIILKRYFRMNGEDQLTVFKNREEFDTFMNSVKEEGTIESNTSKTLSDHSTEFILDNYTGLRDSVTGKIDSIKFDLDGIFFEREDIPDLFDKIVNVLEANKDRARILTKNDFM